MKEGIKKYVTIQKKDKIKTQFKYSQKKQIRRRVYKKQKIQRKNEMWKSVNTLNKEKVIHKKYNKNIKEKNK